MTERTLILGGYGNFGKRIAKALVDRGLKVIIAGRSLERATALVATLPYGMAEAAFINIDTNLNEALAKLKPAVVIHTSGPYQGADYRVAEACIANGCHYLDLSDGRDFVRNFSALDAQAKENNCVLISGASSVPCLSSAIIDHYLPEFSALEAVDFAIAPGQGAERGLATTEAILSYVGKPLRPFVGHPKSYGWQGLRSHTFPVLGTRLLGDCDIPDLDLLPTRYGLKSIRFGASLELGFMHLGLYLMSYLVRFRLVKSLKPLAKPMLKIANLFNRLGSDDGGLWMRLSGRDHDQKHKTVDWYIIAKSGDGPQIPCVPAILLTQRLINKDPSLKAGAISSMGLISLGDYVSSLTPYDIKVYAPI